MEISINLLVVWSAATRRRFQGADESAHSKQISRGVINVV